MEKPLWNKETIRDFEINEEKREKSLSLKQQKQIHNMMIDVLRFFRPKVECKHKDYKDRYLTFDYVYVDKGFIVIETECMLCNKLLVLKIKKEIPYYDFTKETREHE